MCASVFIKRMKNRHLTARPCLSCPLFKRGILLQNYNPSAPLQSSTYIFSIAVVAIIITIDCYIGDLLVVQSFKDPDLSL